MVKTSSSNTEISEILRKAKLPSLAYILLWMPKDYRDFTHLEQTTDLHEAASTHRRTLLEVTVLSRPSESGKTNSHIAFEVESGGERLWVSNFGNLSASRLRNLRVGQKLYVTCKVKLTKREFQLYECSTVDSSKIGTLEPTYSGVRGAIDASGFRHLVSLALDRHLPDAVALLADGLADTTPTGSDGNTIDPMDILRTLKALHAPASVQEHLKGLTKARELALTYVNRRRPIQMPIRQGIAIANDSIASAYVDLGAQLEAEHLAAFSYIESQLRSGARRGSTFSGGTLAKRRLTGLAIAIAATQAGGSAAILTSSGNETDTLVSLARQRIPALDVRQIRSGGFQDENVFRAGTLTIGTEALIHRLSRYPQALDLLVVSDRERHGSALLHRLPEEVGLYIEFTSVVYATAQMIVSFAERRGFSLSYADTADADKAIELRGELDRVLVLGPGQVIPDTLFFDIRIPPSAVLSIQRA